MSGTYAQLTSQLSTSSTPPSSSSSSTTPSSSSSSSILSTPPSSSSSSTSSIPPSSTSSSSTSSMPPSSSSSSSTLSTTPSSSTSSSSKTALAPSGLSYEVLDVLKNRITAYCLEVEHDRDEGIDIIAAAIKLDREALEKSEQFENRLIQHAILLGYDKFPPGISANANTRFDFKDSKTIFFQFDPTIITPDQADDLINLFNKYYPEARCARGINRLSPNSTLLTFDVVGFFKHILPDIAAGIAPTVTPTPSLLTEVEQKTVTNDPLQSYSPRSLVALLFATAIRETQEEEEEQASPTQSPRMGNGAGSS
jgi:hypothetical protein